jgi:hypothetical protein
LSLLDGLKLANLAASRGRLPTVASVFEKADATARQSAAYEEANRINQQLRQDGRPAEIVALFDTTGKIIGRNLNPNADVGTELSSKYLAVGHTLKGNAVKDIWTWQGRVHEVALAPVMRADNTVVGGILLAWVVSAAQAQSNRDLLDVNIGFFHAGRVYASSFVSSVDPSKEDSAKTLTLTNLLYGPQKYADMTLTKGVASEVKTLELEHRKYAAVIASMPGNFADKTSGFVVLASFSDTVPEVHHLGMNIVFLGGLAVVILLAATILTSRRFLAPLDKIELGVAEVINGNIDYTFKPVGQDFEGLSNSLNVMLARLLGREEPNEEAVEEDERAKNAWKAESMLIEDTDGAAAEETVASLSQENEAAYYPRIYNEYLATLRNLGHPSEGISVLAFMAKLSLTEAGLREKWECKTVRFQLIVKDNTIRFRPVKTA